jgi:hypothetical protein
MFSKFRQTRKTDSTGSWSKYISDFQSVFFSSLERKISEVGSTDTLGAREIPWCALQRVQCWRKPLTVFTIPQNKGRNCILYCTITSPQSSVGWQRSWNEIFKSCTPNFGGETPPGKWPLARSRRKWKVIKASFRQAGCDDGTGSCTD